MVLPEIYLRYSVATSSKIGLPRILLSHEAQASDPITKALVSVLQIFIAFLIDSLIAISLGFSFSSLDSSISGDIQVKSMFNVLKRDLLNFELLPRIIFFFFMHFSCIIFEIYKKTKVNLIKGPYYGCSKKQEN